MTLASVPLAKGGVPGLGHVPRLLRNPLAVLRSLHTEGPVVLLKLGTMPMLFVSSPEIVNEVMVRKARSFRKGRLYDRVSGLVGNGLANSDGPVHLRNRRLIQPMFYKERLAGYAEVMSGRADALSASLRHGQQLELNQVMGTYAIETLAATLFAADIGRPAVQAVREDLPVILKYMLRRTLAPTWMDSWPVWSEFNRSVTRMRSVIDEVVVRTRAAGPDTRPDLLSLLLTARDEDGVGFSDEEIRDELTTMLFAGTETTASTLAWALYHLAQNPDVEQAVLDEIEAVVGDRPVAFSDVMRLPAITRVLDETLRLHGVVTLTRRSTEPVTVGGHEIPEGTEILISLYGLHRHPGLYPDPDRFDPDRWLPERTKERPREHAVPFGAGNRRCIGDKFSWMEATITLATLLPRWKLTPRPGARPPAEAASSMAHPDRVEMVVHRRDAP